MRFSLIASGRRTSRRNPHRSHGVDVLGVRRGNPLQPLSKNNRERTVTPSRASNVMCSPSADGHAALVGRRSRSPAPHGNTLSGRRPHDAVWVNAATTASTLPQSLPTRSSAAHLGCGSDRRQLTSFAIAKISPSLSNCRAPSTGHATACIKTMVSAMLPGTNWPLPAAASILRLRDHLSPTDRDDGPAGEFPARKDGEFGVRQLILIANRSLQVGIPDHHVASDPTAIVPCEIEAKKAWPDLSTTTPHLLERDASVRTPSEYSKWQLDLKIVPAGRWLMISSDGSSLSSRYTPHDPYRPRRPPLGSGTPQVVRITLLAQRRSPVKIAPSGWSNVPCQVQVQNRTSVRLANYAPWPPRLSALRALTNVDDVDRRARRFH